MAVLRWGMLGTSFISDVVARSILASQNSTISAVFGRNETRLTAFANKHGIAERYTSIDELLDKAEIDVVYVGLPNHMHTPAVLAAAKRGKAILSEKSLATTMEDAKAIEKAVKNAGVFFLEGLMYLTHPLMKKTQELLLEGKIGTVRGVSGYYSANIWKKANPLSMGTIYNLGCYPVSLLHFVIETAFGSDAFEKRQLHGFGNISTEGSVHVRDASLTVRFDNGVLASLQSTDSYGNDSSFTILGDKGRIRFVTNPWLPIAGDNIIEIKTYGGATEQVIVPAEMDAFGYQVKKVEDYLSRGVKTAERPSPNVDQSVEIMGLLTEWEALIQSQHK
ncbi:D-xylose 1-dehydrogenase (NADP(+)) 2 [Fusarium oxysporum f. sp. rapae]|uniref:D-xylose 1-dehydrogenase (NADP(+), D-xylono-1,5-lactone-forming) n=1 Tax=Fusarium oxysporum f. sp. rapae TaxID=485398 RepID=A0A8J5NSR2_FUSOX|nr:D-xylose 1-dehydrogenase (NADP(+)) 2 [Fusarium oxysporum f. sp. rapae]